MKLFRQKTPIKLPCPGKKRTPTSQKSSMADISGDHLFDIIMIGAGIMGSCAAYEASKLGEKVIFLEQFDLLHHLGSSHGESRTIRATYADPYYPPMVIESSRLWEAAQSAAGYRVITPTTQLDLGPAENPSLQSCIRNCSQDSLPAKLFYAESTDPSDLPGAFHLPEGWVAISTPLAGVIKPTKAVARIQRCKSCQIMKDQGRQEDQAVEFKECQGHDKGSKRSKA